MPLPSSREGTPQPTFLPSGAVYGARRRAFLNASASGLLLVHPFAPFSCFSSFLTYDIAPSMVPPVKRLFPYNHWLLSGISYGFLAETFERMADISQSRVATMESLLRDASFASARLRTRATRNVTGKEIQNTARKTQIILNLERVSRGKMRPTSRTLFRGPHSGRAPIVGRASAGNRTMGARYAYTISIATHVGISAVINKAARR